MVSPLIGFLLGGGFERPSQVWAEWQQSPWVMVKLPAIGCLWAAHIFFAGILLRYFLIPRIPFPGGARAFLSTAALGCLVGSLAAAGIYASCLFLLGVTTFHPDRLNTTIGFAGLLGGIFSLMFAGFHEADLRVKELEQARIELERSHLQAQLMNLNLRIRPHFFFNALNTLAALMDRDRDQAQEFLADLADLFRLSFTIGQGGPNCRLSEELELLKRYVAVERMRFPGKLHFKLELNASEDAPFPAFFLQPLLENAVHHGVARCREGGVIRLTLQRDEDGWWHFCLGNSQENGQTFAFRPGHALETVRQRVEMMGGELAVESTAHWFELRGRFLLH
jgi:LytS/YehU family sensor histidine kinase